MSRDNPNEKSWGSVLPPRPRLMLDQGEQSLSVVLLRGVLLIGMRLLFLIEHRGRQHIPPAGPLIIAPNHVTYFDPAWVAVRIYRTVRFMAWDKIFGLPVAGGLFRWLGAFPVNLENPEFGMYRTALEILDGSGALMVFPEGGRSPDGSLLTFKEGAARLALHSGANILPVAISGGAHVWSSQMTFPRPGKVLVSYLPPIQCPMLSRKNKQEFDLAAAELTQRIRSAILQGLQT